MSWVWVADMAVAISGSAVFSATIEEMTNKTPKQAPVSTQTRADVDKPANAKSLPWLGGAKASTTRHPLRRIRCAFETGRLEQRLAVSFRWR